MVVRLLRPLILPAILFASHISRTSPKSDEVACGACTLSTDSSQICRSSTFPLMSLTASDPCARDVCPSWGVVSAEFVQEMDSAIGWDTQQRIATTPWEAYATFTCPNGTFMFGFQAPCDNDVRDAPFIYIFCSRPTNLPPSWDGPTSTIATDWGAEAGSVNCSAGTYLVGYKFGDDQLALRAVSIICAKPHDVVCVDPPENFNTALIRSENCSVIHQYCVVTLSCKLGYAPISGFSVVECKKDGTYNNSLLRCVDIDECMDSAVCGADQICTNTPGGYSCVCQRGFKLIDGECVDVDECLVACAAGVADPIAGQCNNCTGGSYCLDFVGGFTCGPICSTCDVTVNHTGNSTVIVGPVEVVIPPSIFNSSNSTVRIIVTPFSSGPSTQDVPGGGYIVSITLQDPAQTSNGSTNLASPIKFVIPYSPQALSCLQDIVPVCVWWDGVKWASSGCTSSPFEQKGTECSCSHLTDFAVLLDQSQGNSCAATSQPTDVYYPFAVAFCAIAVYCTIVNARLLKVWQWKQTGTYIKHHALIEVVSLLRLFSCLQFIGVFGHSLVLASILTCAPYPFEYWLFTRLAASWASVVSAPMESADRQWQRVRPWFLGTNVLGVCLSIVLLVLFVEDIGDTAAILATAALCVIYVALAVLFHVYSNKLVVLLASAVPSSRSTTDNSGRKCGDLVTRAKWGGRTATYCFAVQAITNVVALTAESGLPVWTGLFLVSNVLALGCLLFLYGSGTSKVLADSLPKLVSSSQRKEDTVELQ